MIIRTILILQIILIILIIILIILIIIIIIMMIIIIILLLMIIRIIIIPILIILILIIILIMTNNYNNDSDDDDDNGGNNNCLFFYIRERGFKMQKTSNMQGEQEEALSLLLSSAGGFGTGSLGHFPTQVQDKFPTPYSPANPELPSYGGQVHSQCESFARFGSCQGYGTRVRVGNEWKRVAGVHNQSGIFYFFFQHKN